MRKLFNFPDIIYNKFIFFLTPNHSFTRLKEDILI